MENDEFQMMDYYLKESCQYLQMITSTCTRFIQMKSTKTNNNWIQNVIGFAPNKIQSNMIHHQAETMLRAKGYKHMKVNDANISPIL